MRQRQGFYGLESGIQRTAHFRPEPDGSRTYAEDPGIDVDRLDRWKNFSRNRFAGLDPERVIEQRVEPLVAADDAVGRL